MCSTVRPNERIDGVNPKPSVTLEAFTMLQLYIGVAGVNSVEDALRCFTKSENLESYKVWNSPTVDPQPSLIRISIINAYYRAIAC